MNHTQNHPLLPTPHVRLTSGPMGTALRRLVDNISVVLPTRFDYWSRDYGRCTDMLNITDPELVDTLSREYLRAGADILIANTFLSNSILLSPYKLERYATALCRSGVEIAIESIRSFEDIDNAEGNYGQDRPHFVAAMIAPLNLDGAMLSNRRKAFDAYFNQAEALIKAGAKEIFVETITDSRIALEALRAIDEASAAKGKRVKRHASFTLRDDDRLFSGESLPEAVMSIARDMPDTIGINCVFPASRAAENCLRLAELSSLPLSLRPSASAGPGGRTDAPEEFADAFIPLLRNRRLAIAGPCCGGGVTHVAALRKLIDRLVPAKHPVNTNPTLN